MPSSPELAGRLRWFIQLRWLAAGGIVLAAGAAAVSGVSVAWKPLCALAVVLALLNAAYLGLTRSGRQPLYFAAVQIAGDLVVLTLALHYSGGIENPCAFFYVFHVIIAAILFPGRVSYFVAGLASASFLTLVLFEHQGWMPHIELGLVRWRETRVLAGAAVIMSSTLFLAAYLATTIMEGLRRKEEEVRRFNEGMLQTEKMAAVGQLAAGVAHELNTPLASIAGYAEELQAIVKGGGERVEHYAGVIRSQIERCKGITQSLLNFARKGELRVRPLDVNPLLLEAAEYLRFKKKEPGYAVETDFGPLPLVNADPGQLLQVFLSILVNAADAMEAGGSIRVRTRAEDGRVLINVSDTGCGIPVENLKKIFEPFFTTKAPGQGTGLGLSLSYGIVKQLGGTIQVVSRHGHGTTVTISLPPADGGSS